jgi:hypothetical protein
MYGVASHVSALQTETGVKDGITSHWIQILINKARKMRAEQPGRSPDAIAQELKTWLDAQPGDKMNPLLFASGLDPARDTPVEILHTFLLGIVKYAWYMIHSPWKDGNPHAVTLIIRMASIDTDGLDVAELNAAYIWQYRNNLIGKHFKTQSETLIFSLHGLVSVQIFQLVNAVGFLGAALWITEIDDMDAYCVCCPSHAR